MENILIICMIFVSLIITIVIIVFPIKLGRELEKKTDDINNLGCIIVNNKRNKAHYL